METPSTYHNQRTGGSRLRLAPMLLILLLSLCAASDGIAQNLLSQSFDNVTFPPTGWTRTTGSPIWNRVTSGTWPSQSPHSGAGEAQFNSFSVSSGSAELTTPAVSFSGTSLVQVSFWMYRDAGYSGTTGEKVDVYANTTATSTGGSLLGSVVRWSGGTPAVSSDGWYKYVFNVPGTFSGTTNYIVFKATSQFGNDIFIDDVSIDNLAPCTGAPTAGIQSPACGTTSNVCPGSIFGLNAINSTVASNLTYQWMYSINGGTTWLPVPSGGNTPNYTTFPITQSTRFHMVITCANSGLSDSTCNRIFNVTGTGPTYASLPFTEGFENWQNGCSTKDLPSANWTNQPATGDNSFRRYDEGATANWNPSYITSGTFAPQAAQGTYCARWHGYYAPVGGGNAGMLSAYVNCSGFTGNAQLDFYTRTYPTPGTYPGDSIIVDFSSDGGMTFSNLAKYGAGTGGWDFKSLSLPATNTATTVIRWSYKDAYQYYGDMGLDGVRVLPPCAAKPTAGKIDTISACPGKNFTLSLTGTSMAAGLTYLWQYKPTGSSAGWTNLPGGTVPKPTANISVPTSFRVIVSCSNTLPTPLDDTSLVYDVKLNPFYYCYCTVPTSVTYPNYYYNTIGNVTVTTRPAGVTLLNNGNPLPTLSNPNATSWYTDYTKTVPAPTLIRDSTYRFAMTAYTNQSYFYTGYPAAFFLDLNRDGVFNPALATATPPGEMIMSTTIGSSTAPTVFKDFKIPVTAAVGLTGLRAIHTPLVSTTINPCGAFTYPGEAEDYLVYIEYQPCNGPVDPGLAYISDTSVCPGYTVDIWDTGYEKKRTGIVRIWQTSTNGGASYNNIAGSANKDTVFNVPITASSYGTKFRLAVICTNTGDTTYSNVMDVFNPAPVNCYPFASAIPPGALDSSDIGSFVIGPYATPFINPQPMVVSGPHLGNPAANRRRTDYTYIPNLSLAADTTYRIAVYHTMRTLNHADAMVSVFIDFNHDGRYSVGTPGYPFPPELIFRGRTTASKFYLDTTFKMPSTLIPNVPTGLRVVLNNDLNTTAVGNGNDGAGGFISGEVEDYVVTLTRTALNVPGSSLVTNLAIFPNPTDAKATVIFDAAKAISHVDVIVTTITGQQVMTRSFDNAGTRFSTELDLSGKAKGVYFVEIHADGEKQVRKLTVH